MGNREKPKSAPQRTAQESAEIIDKFQTLVDAQDEKYDLMCEVEGHDYGHVLIRELEAFQGELFHDFGQYERRNLAEGRVTMYAIFLDEMVGVLEGVLGEDVLSAMEEKVSVSILERLEKKVAKKQTKIEEEYDLRERYDGGLSESRKTLLIERDVYTKEEVDQLEMYLARLQGILKTVPDMRGDYQFSVAARDVKKALLMDPQFTITLLEHYLQSSYWGNTSIDSILGFLGRDFFDEGWDKLYVEEPEMIKDVLMIDMNMFELIEFFGNILVPHWDKFKKYPTELVRIKKTIGNGSYANRFSEYQFFNSGGIYETYFVKDPEGITRMIEISGADISDLLEFSPDEFLQSFADKGFAEDVEKNWRALAAITGDFSHSSTDRMDHLKPTLERLWPDIKANPEIIEQLSGFVVGQRWSDDRESEAYLAARENILARPDEFVHMMEEMKPLCSQGGRYHEDYMLARTFKDKVAAVWPSFAQKFNDEGYSDEMKMYLSHIMQLPNLDKEAYEVLHSAFMARPTEVREMMDQIVEYGDKGIDTSAVIELTFPAVKEKFVEEGYSDSVKQYMENAVEILELLDWHYRAAKAVLPSMMPDVLQHGLQESHKAHLRFILEEVLPRVAIHRVENVAFFNKLTLYLNDDRVAEDLKEEILKYDTASGLRVALERFEEESSRKHPWFADKYLEDGAEMIARHMHPEDFPLDVDKMKMVFAEANNEFDGGKTNGFFSMQADLFSIPEAEFKLTAETPRA